ncbi:MAG: hypothetical protein QM761_12940 [Pseudoxanthomonas sp.]
MKLLSRKLPLALLLALSGLAGNASAQGKPQDQTTVLPVWNNDGKVEALLYLDPTGETATGAKWRFGRNTLGAAFGLDAGDSLGLVCNRQTGIGSSIGNLISHCNVAAFDRDRSGSAGQRLVAGASLDRDGNRVGLSAGTGRSTLPAWLNPGHGTAEIEQNDLAVFGESSIGREGFVRIGGAVARARLVPAADLAPAVTDRWNSRSLSVGGGYGAFSADIIGRVVDVPGQPNWKGLGLGLTWRTPWSGQLTVGAENVITRGKNPFSPASGDVDEGNVPYVRYEQDL